MALAATLASPAPARSEGLVGSLRELKKEFRSLDVSDTQKAQMKDIMKSHRAELRAANDRVFAAREAVADAVHQDTVDEALIRQKVQESAKAQADAAVLRARVHAEVRGVLTPEQRQKADGIRTTIQGAIRELRTAVRAFLDAVL
jgi:Spy/CpxP family protein refolding chaperone